MTYDTTHHHWEVRITEMLTRSGQAVEHLSPRTWRVSLWPEHTVRNRATLGVIDRTSGERNLRHCPSGGGGIVNN